MLRKLKLVKNLVPIRRFSANVDDSSSTFTSTFNFGKSAIDCSVNISARLVVTPQTSFQSKTSNNNVSAPLVAIGIAGVAAAVRWAYLAYRPVRPTTTNVNVSFTPPQSDDDSTSLPPVKEKRWVIFKGEEDPTFVPGEWISPTPEEMIETETGHKRVKHNVAILTKEEEEPKAKEGSICKGTAITGKVGGRDLKSFIQQFPADSEGDKLEEASVATNNTRVSEESDSDEAVQE